MSEKLLFKSKKSRPEKEWKYHEYIKMKREAEKNGNESFVYKDITYTQSLILTYAQSSTPFGVLVYVREQNL